MHTYKSTCIHSRRPLTRLFVRESTIEFGVREALEGGPQCRISIFFKSSFLRIPCQF